MVIANFEYVGNSVSFEIFRNEKCRNDPSENTRKSNLIRFEQEKQFIAK